MLLEIAEFKTLVPAVSVEDEGLQLLLDAAEDAINARYGPLGNPITDVIEGGQSFVWLSRRADSITSITETVDGITVTTLDPADYRLGRDGVSVRRLGTGTHPPSYPTFLPVTNRWAPTVTVVLVPADDEADRKRVQLHLVKQDLGYDPGTTAEQIGAWLEQKANNSVWNYADEREAILGTLLAGFAPGFA